MTTYKVVQVGSIHDDGIDICSFPTRERAQKYVEAVTGDVDGVCNDGQHWLEIQEVSHE